MNLSPTTFQVFAYFSERFQSICWSAITNMGNWILGYEVSNYASN